MSEFKAHMVHELGGSGDGALQVNAHSDGMRCKWLRECSDSARPMSTGRFSFRAERVVQIELASLLYRHAVVNILQVSSSCFEAR